MKILWPAHIGLWKREMYTQVAVGFSQLSAARDLSFHKSSLYASLDLGEKDTFQGSGGWLTWQVPTTDKSSNICLQEKGDSVAMKTG